MNKININNERLTNIFVLSLNGIIYGVQIFVVFTKAFIFLKEKYYIGIVILLPVIVGLPLAVLLGTVRKKRKKRMDKKNSDGSIRSRCLDCEYSGKAPSKNNDNHITIQLEIKERKRLNVNGIL